MLPSSSCLGRDLGGFVEGMERPRGEPGREENEEVIHFLGGEEENERHWLLQCWNFQTWTDFLVSGLGLWGGSIPSLPRESDSPQGDVLGTPRMCLRPSGRCHLQGPSAEWSGRFGGHGLPHMNTGCT